MKKALLCVLDGFGYGPDYEGNAITRAKAPYLHQLFQSAPWTLLDASGESVGIPAGTQGGSEVGHLTMGAGRIVYQTLLRIDQSIEDRSLFKKEALLEAAKHVKRKDSALHILGLISDGGVHSHLNHALALIDFASEQGLSRVFVHGITDGRDVPPKSAAIYVQRLLEYMKEKKTGKLATLIGRYFAMDRDQNWDRTAGAYELYCDGIGKLETDPLQALANAYAGGLESDYYLPALRFDETALIHPEDSVIFFNFRTDRARQLTEQFLKGIKPHFVAFGPYTDQAPVVFPAEKVEHNLGSLIEAAGGEQLRAAETEKYAHVTYFFNSQIEAPFPHEKRILIESPKCASYAEKPEMSAIELTQAVLSELDKNYAFIALNFANLDLVGHSGDLEATKKAVEIISESLSKIIPKALEKDFSVVLVGDHGNAEMMLYEDGSPCPSHTRNPVPCFVLSSTPLEVKGGSHERATGGLQDIAPTLLQLMELPQPSEMTGHSLIKIKN